MRFKISALIVVALFSIAAFAQDTDSPKMQVFGGYSLLHADTAGVSNADVDASLGTTGSGVSSNFSGWNGEFQYNLRPSLGVVADISGNYGTPISVASDSGLPSAPSLTSYSFLFGPVLQRSSGKLSPFVHALFGVNRLSTNSTAATNLDTAVGALVPANFSDSAFAMALGGGLDYKLSKSFGVRLAQLDYLYTRHDALSYSDSFYGTDSPIGAANHQNNLRLSAGLVFGF